MANLKQTTVDSTCTVYENTKINGDTLHFGKNYCYFYSYTPTSAEAFQQCSNFIINKDYQNNIGVEFVTNTTNQHEYCLTLYNKKNSRTNGETISALNTKTKTLFSSTNPTLVASIETKWFSSSGKAGFSFKSLINTNGIVQDQAIFNTSLIQLQNTSFENLHVNSISLLNEPRFVCFSQFRVFDSSYPITTNTVRYGNLSLRQRSQSSNAGIHFVLPSLTSGTIPNVSILDDGTSLNYVGESQGRSVSSGWFSWSIRSYNSANSSIGRAQGALLFSYLTNSMSSYSTKGFINPNVGSPISLNFTGQHRNIASDTTQEYNNKIGLIVVSTGKYSSLGEKNISINESLPIIELSSETKQNNVFGVVSQKEDVSDKRNFSIGVLVSSYEKNDDRIIINSLGEGSIWISNINGTLENGDYITTCEIEGYGARQEEDVMHSYTVAKITCDCEFDLNSTRYICEEFEWKGQTYRRAFVGCTYHCG